MEFEGLRSVERDGNQQQCQHCAAGPESVDATGLCGGLSFTTYQQPQKPPSALQDELAEIRRRCPVVAEVVNGRADRREREGVKRLCSHLVEVFLSGKASGDMRHVMLAGMIWRKHLNVFNQGRNNGIFGRGDESGCGSVFHHERSHGINHRLLHLQQFRSRLDDNTLKAKRTIRNIVVLEGLQLQAGDMVAVQSLANGGVDLVEITSASAESQRRFAVFILMVVPRSILLTLSNRRAPRLVRDVRGHARRRASEPAHSSGNGRYKPGSSQISIIRCLSVSGNLSPHADTSASRLQRSGYVNNQPSAFSRRLPAAHNIRRPPAGEKEWRRPQICATEKLSYSHVMDDTSNGVPQFATAEFAPAVPTMTCSACRQPIDGPYFQINGARACAECANKIRDQTPNDSHAAFVRALAFGIGGAVVGFLLYVVSALVTGLVIGLVSLAVGFIIGKAMHLGSRGVGGRRYQLVAALLTYLAVSMSAVPIAIHQMRQKHEAQVQSQNTAAPHQHLNVAKAIGVLVLLGIASPFLDLQDPVHGLIGLVILFVGIRFAWRFTAGREIIVSGPHTQSPAGVI
jgi:hypothetical protein